MSWLRLDDGFADHPKLLELPDDRARWMFVRLLCHCARYRTGGAVAPATLRHLHASRRQVDAFTAAGLLELDENGALRVHDFELWNPSGSGDVVAAVRAYLESNPDASANEVAAAVPGTRSVILEAVRLVRSGSDAGTANQSRTGSGTGSRARASRPVPSVPKPSSSTNHGGKGAAAAGLGERLTALGLSGVPDVERADSRLVEAWLELADHEATRNPAGFVLAGIRANVHPSPRARTEARDPVARRRAFVEADGWRMPADALEDVLGELGAEGHELAQLLDEAADRRREVSQSPPNQGRNA